MLPVRWLRAAHNNRGEEGAGKLPEPVEVTHPQGMNILTLGAPISGADVDSGITEGMESAPGGSPPRPGRLTLLRTENSLVDNCVLDGLSVAVQ